jgi:uncharacterized membrane protein YcaP (DUF421 family)
MTLCVASLRVFIVFVVVYFVMTQSGNFWIHRHISPMQFANFCIMIHMERIANIICEVRTDTNSNGFPSATYSINSRYQIASQCLG